jgi:hypothetical protein
MTEDELDEVTLQKILGAAEEIKGMAKIRPADAPAMLEQARHLTELAEQIRSDWLRRRNSEEPLDRPNTLFAGQGSTPKRDPNGALAAGYEFIAARPAR